MMLSTAAFLIATTVTHALPVIGIISGVPASFSTVARPILRPDPVTSATLPCEHVPSRCELFGGGLGRLSGLAQHPFSRRGDAGASEKARILAAEEAHDVGECEIAEIGRGRQPVLDHLIVLG